jgi:hypothetical protein
MSKFDCGKLWMREKETVRPWTNPPGTGSNSSFGYVPRRSVSRVLREPHVRLLLNREFLTLEGVQVLDLLRGGDWHEVGFLDRGRG